MATPRERAVEVKKKYRASVMVSGKTAKNLLIGLITEAIEEAIKEDRRLRKRGKE